LFAGFIDEQIRKHALKQNIKVHHIRLMLLGHTGAGKTATTKRLLGRKIDDIKERESTNGVEIHTSSISLSSKKWNTGSKVYCVLILQNVYTAFQNKKNQFNHKLV
jgi:septin family protein